MNLVLDTVAIRHCEPLFVTDPFLEGGHSSERANGTITYVQFNEQVYGITCAHIYYQQCLNNKWLTIHGKGGYVYELGRFTNEAYKSNFRPLRKEGDSDGPDIAIIFLGDDFRELHFSKKGKLAINLDDRVKLNWDEVNLPSAFGYPTEHKSQTLDFVESHLLHVKAKITRKISPSDTSFLLASTLESEHGYFFSGMSGGPVLHVHDSGEITLIGIVYEGIPGSSKDWLARDKQAFLTSSDIQIRAHTLTPEIFEGKSDLGI